MAHFIQVYCTGDGVIWNFSTVQMAMGHLLLIGQRRTSESNLERAAKGMKNRQPKQNQKKNR